MSLDRLDRLDPPDLRVNASASVHRRRRRGGAEEDRRREEDRREESGGGVE